VGGAGTSHLQGKSPGNEVVVCGSNVAATAFGISQDWLQRGAGLNLKTLHFFKLLSWRRFNFFQKLKDQRL